MNSFKIICAFVFCVVLIGCSKDAQINAFIAELDSTGKEMVAKIDADPSAAGIGQAQALFESKKPSLKSKWEPIKGIYDFQVSFEIKQKLQESVRSNRDTLNAAYDKGVAKTGPDLDARTKFDELMTSYEEFFTK